MTYIKITLPVKEWEDCVLAFREKQKREWEKKQQRAGDTSGTAQHNVMRG